MTFKLRLLPMLRSRVAKQAVTVLVLAVFLLVLIFNFNPGITQAATSAVASVPISPVVIIINIFRILLGVIGVGLLGLAGYAGYLWFSSQGDPDIVEKAKKLLKKIVIGLLIVLSLFLLVTWILYLINRPAPTPPDNLGNQNDVLDFGAGIGSGPIASVYPVRDQKNVPINTMIAVTFKSDVDPKSICEDSDGNGRCYNEKIQNVEICQVIDGICVTDPQPFFKGYFAETKVYQRTGDNKTYVFSTNKYLGFEDKQNRDFMVILKPGILKADGSGSIFAGFKNGYNWKFTTNGELDLNPPSIISLNRELNPADTQAISGVYPDPDNKPDHYVVAVPPTPATFNFSLGTSTLVLERKATTSLPIKGKRTNTDAMMAGNYRGTSTGQVNVLIDANTGKAGVVWPGQAVQDDKAYRPDSTQINLGYGLALNLRSVADRGSSWSFFATSSLAGDKIDMVSSGVILKSYVLGQDVMPGKNSDELMINLREGIMKDFASIFKICPKGAYCLMTQSVGDEAASYDLAVTSANPGAMIISKAGGEDAHDGKVAVDRPDAYKNTAFQINFNKAINPLTIDSLVVQYGKADSNAETKTKVAYSATLSNDYRTIELVSKTECARDACNEPIYCWPTNDKNVASSTDKSNKATKYEIQIKAADLQACNATRCAVWGGQCDNNNLCVKNVTSTTVFYPTSTPCTTAGWCSKWNGSCSLGRCVKTEKEVKVFYPAADFTTGGLTDLSGNSFNGSFNYYFANQKTIGIANGPGAISYNLNNSAPLYNPSNPTVKNSPGDNLNWSFWLSDKIDLQSPLLKTLDPQGGNQFFPADSFINLIFDKVMLASTIKSGWNYGEVSDAKAKSRIFLTLNSLPTSTLPLAYWVGGYGQDTNNDGFPDRTFIYVDHDALKLGADYSVTAGSGLKSITQNCFFPGVGPQNAQNDSTCRHTNSEDNATSGCVNDESLGSNKVALPNPVSYAQAECAEITGAVSCAQGDPTKVCKASFYDPTKGQYDESGSWIVTADHPTAIGLKLKSNGKEMNLTDNGRTGCCLGKCEPVINPNICTKIGAKVCQQNEECRDQNYPGVNVYGKWLLTSDYSLVLDNSGRTGCCFGRCILVSGGRSTSSLNRTNTLTN